MRLIDVTDDGRHRRHGHPAAVATTVRSARPGGPAATEHADARAGAAATSTAAGSARSAAVTSMAPFRIPDGGEAGTPAELRGAAAEIGTDGRAAVRLMVTHRAGTTVEHLPFGRLPDALDAGDVLVVNTSAVIPAALDAHAAGPGDPEVRLHLSTEQPGGFWVVEPRRPAGAGSDRLTGTPPTRLALPGGGRAELLAPYPSSTAMRRLWLARLDLPTDTLAYLGAHGQPIRYAHVEGAWPIEAYQSVFSWIPGSAEMPSAARPFTHGLVTDLVTRGVAIAPVTLHTGVSSQEAGEPPYAERYSLPPATVALVNGARRDGRRIIAVGTTVVRALETTADEQGRAHPGSGWTELVVTPERGVRVVDGLITGWHEPESSHLALLEAIAGRDLLDTSYAAAVAGGYRWHEFGDSHLILP
ncbi:MAG TPA: S-adenosylmethionine:tRNA ribosyltransferase-isomerase [Acidimicrobiales bacterium]|nr:S-adenosylmethionine:tRNA ribosyltransferase-isomerase [Acidimicrobiales bacterium]